VTKVVDPASRPRGTLRKEHLRRQRDHRSRRVSDRAAISTSHATAPSVPRHAQQANASRDKKLKGADAVYELRARGRVSRPVAEYLAPFDAALPPSPDGPASVEPASVSPTCRRRPPANMAATLRLRVRPNLFFKDIETHWLEEFIPDVNVRRLLLRSTGLLFVN
jgi:hypothetical protein